MTVALALVVGGWISLSSFVPTVSRSTFTVRSHVRSSTEPLYLYLSHMHPLLACLLPSIHLISPHLALAYILTLTARLGSAPQLPNHSSPCFTLTSLYRKQQLVWCAHAHDD